MALIHLKKEIIKKVKDDAILYGKVAQALGISAPSLRPLLKANHVKLTQIGVLLVIQDHLSLLENNYSFGIYKIIDIPKSKNEKTGSNTK